MRKILVNYADIRHFPGQRRSARLGFRRGGFDLCLSYGRGDLSPDFIAEHSILLNARRGAGYWLWKPVIILDAMERAQDGDVIVYLDSDCYFKRSVDLIAEACVERTPGVLGFSMTGLSEGAWTKRDAFILMGCDSEEMRRGGQFMAGLIVFVNNAFAKAFVREWFALMQDPRLLSDLPNVCGSLNYPEFRDHRHDQSIFSLLYKRHGLQCGGELGEHLVRRACVLQDEAGWREWLVPFYDRRWRKGSRLRRRRVGSIGSSTLPPL